MNVRLARLLTRLYPRRWRERYGEELEALLLESGSSLRASANVVWRAILEHIFPTGGRNMGQDPYSFRVMARKPTALLPVAMSLAALAVVGIAAIYSFAHTGHGLVREPDEGTAAHLWQLLMGGQAPFLVFFAVKWLPRATKQAFLVLGLQAVAILASMAPVFFLNL